MKRTMILLTITLLSLALFTACTSSADTMPQTSPIASAQPTAAPTTAPTGTMEPNISVAPSATDNAMGMTQTTDTMNNGGVNTMEDARRVADEISEEVEKLSEIDDAETVVAGNIALVAIEYEDQYQGGLTDRLKDMITERVETINKAITSVHVTDSKETTALLKELHNKMQSADMTFEELQTQLLNLGSAITGGGTPEVSQPQSNTGA